MSFKDYHRMKIDPDLINHLDDNMHKVGQNYWKYGQKRKFPSSFRAFYVNIMAECPDTGKQKKQIMGPYSRKTAEHLMTQMLSEGKCSWVEEDWIR